MWCFATSERSGATWGEERSDVYDTVCRMWHDLRRQNRQDFKSSEKGAFQSLKKCRFFNMHGCWTCPPQWSQHSVEWCTHKCWHRILAPLRDVLLRLGTSDPNPDIWIERLVVCLLFMTLSFVHHDVGLYCLCMSSVTFTTIGIHLSIYFRFWLVYSVRLCCTSALPLRITVGKRSKCLALILSLWHVNSLSSLEMNAFLADKGISRVKSIWYNCLKVMIQNSSRSFLHCSMGMILWSLLKWWNVCRWASS